MDFIEFPTGNPGDGIFPSSLINNRFFWNRTGATIAEGYVGQLDLKLSHQPGGGTGSADVINMILGHVQSGTANVVAPTAGAIAGNEFAIFVVAGDSAADDSQFRGTVFGFAVSALVVDNNVSPAALAVGDELVVTTSGYLDRDTATGERVTAIALEASSAALSATPALYQVWMVGHVPMASAA